MVVPEQQQVAVAPPPAAKLRSRKAPAADAAHAAGARRPDSGCDATRRCAQRDNRPAAAARDGSAQANKPRRAKTRKKRRVDAQERAGARGCGRGAAPPRRAPHRGGRLACEPRRRSRLRCKERATRGAHRDRVARSVARLAHRRRSHRALRRRRQDVDGDAPECRRRHHRRIRAVELGVLVRRPRGPRAADDRLRRDVHATSASPSRSISPAWPPPTRATPRSTPLTADASAPTTAAAPGGRFRATEGADGTETARNPGPARNPRPTVLRERADDRPAFKERFHDVRTHFSRRRTRGRRPRSRASRRALAVGRRRTGDHAAGERIAVRSGPHDDARRSGRAVADRLQLRHRAGARRPQPAAGARHRQPALHGHRRNRQSRDGAFPIAHRAVAGERARAELRIRPARSRQAAAQVRRPRSDADAQPHRKAARRARKK